ncbi:MAG: endolytic transglycosylase MltG [Bacillota bacterium]|nr:endolytic transglycosylase MltG [Bacillota bacterium]MDW7683256.1 endolytic transglycosylase MltG [Bacillota bacterium]
MNMRTPLRLLGGFAILSVVAFALFAMQLNTMLQPVDVPAVAQESVLVSLPAGSSSVRIAGILEENGLVRNATVFRYYAKYKGMDQKLKAGNYVLQYGMTMDELLAELTEGNVYRPTIKVTIPEGYVIEQIAERLSQTGLVDYDEFMDLAAATVPAMGQTHPDQRYALEGYLYPDTYEFDVDASPQAIINRMQARLKEVFTPDMHTRAKELGLSFQEVIILASLVEREVQAPQERELVAAVLHNRLKRKMPLQLCASVLYALGEHRPRVLYEDLEIDSPYNTYKISGLPPGPIASPGKQSVMAVLYPADVDYLYYVAKEDGSGTHLFGRTNAEHQANIRKVRNR